MNSLLSIKSYLITYHGVKMLLWIIPVYFNPCFNNCLNLCFPKSYFSASLTIVHRIWHPLSENIHLMQLLSLAHCPTLMCIYLCYTLEGLCGLTALLLTVTFSVSKLYVLMCVWSWQISAVAHRFPWQHHPHQSHDLQHFPGGEITQHVCFAADILLIMWMMVKTVCFRTDDDEVSVLWRNTGADHLSLWSLEGKVTQLQTAVQLRIRPVTPGPLV